MRRDRTAGYLPAAVVVFGIVCQLLYAGANSSLGDTVQLFALSMLLSLAASAVGVFLGFLVGAPKYVEASRDPTAREPGISYNNNFREISDWLTKILIGIGLVQIGEIRKYLDSFVESTSTSLQIPQSYILYQL